MRHVVPAVPGRPQWERPSAPRPRRHPGVRADRGLGRLQPRRRGPDRDAGGGRFDLAGHGQGAASASAAQLQTNAQTYFNAVFTRTDAAAPTVSVNYSTNGSSQVVVTASSSVNTMFMGIMGFRQLPVFATSTSTWGNKRLRVALVLDNTGSMSSGSPTSKISALKTATHNLLGQLRSAAVVDGDVYVSIIPFSKDVNVGPSNYNQDWIDWSEWDQDNGSCNLGYHHYGSCTSNGGTWTPAARSTWNGCVTDRDQNYDTMNTPPTSGAKFPAEQFSGCSASLMTQSYDWTALNNKVDAMVATGNTNQAIGIAWGWQSLSAGSRSTRPPRTQATSIRTSSSS